jgi:hypothetical protein
MQPPSASFSIPLLCDLAHGERARSLNRSHRLVTATFVLEPPVPIKCFLCTPLSLSTSKTLMVTMIESNPKAACAKCCLKSLWNLAFSSQKPRKVKVLINISRYQNQPTWCQSTSRSNARGFELKLVVSGMIESNPKAASAKCCLKSLWNPTLSSLKPWKIKVQINILRYQNQPIWHEATLSTLNLRHSHPGWSKAAQKLHVRNVASNRSEIRHVHH